MTQSIIRVHNLAEVNDRQPTFVAIGSFDGVHRGHQLLLQNMVEAAKKEGARTAVLTFFPHPKRVLQNLTGPYYLTTLEDRVTLLAEQGVDLVVTLPFDEEVRHTRAADFVNQMQRYLNMRQLWGGNFAFGYKREGDVPFLRRLGQEKGFSVQLVKEMVQLGDGLVSSSRVRAGLASGDVEDVAGCLARPYHIRGVVVMGDQRGRTIGFPTANLDIWDEQLLPENGVYATYAWVGEQRFIAATNVGVRPTINGGNVTVEAHLLDFTGNLYGQELKLEFIHHIRPEMKFASLDVLKAQIRADVQTIRQQIT
ncbi:MAG: bifunctional riboflavin kinase/FAD synthetase [Ardenticatenaceae bacterium]|nr:bifunctional riboflavin kinase/FAD synthetase [Ardenticatenaceae bacterium]MCB9443811.1 bifunctional riboflavin kinase/FAD synthetase [Ardenticatenaceae bacterium]